MEIDEEEISISDLSGDIDDVVVKNEGICTQCDCFTYYHDSVPRDQFSRNQLPRDQFSRNQLLMRSIPI